MHDGQEVRTRADEEVVDYATALLCAEAVGAIKYATDATLEYLKRKAFRRAHRSFQALQHRMVDMVISGEQRSRWRGSPAPRSIRRPICRRKRVVSAAKIKIADACRHVAQEAIQLHGGMGMSDELKISHTFRADDDRAAVRRRRSSLERFAKAC